MSLNTQLNVISIIYVKTETWVNIISISFQMGPLILRSLVEQEECQVLINSQECYKSPGFCKMLWKYQKFNAKFILTVLITIIINCLQL